MKEINNLIYTLEINYVNNSGLNNSIIVKFHDNGLEIKSFRVGDVCITEETINGRVLSGTYENVNKCCGYRYDYKNGEYLLNINPQIPIDTAISLINKQKMELNFLSAKMVLVSILKSDYKVVMLNNGNLKVIKTISAENEKFELYTLQECTDLLKLDGEESFVVQDKKRVYKINNSIIEENQTLVNSDIKSQLNKLSDIISQNPQSYKDLINFKNQIQKQNPYSSANDEKAL